MKNIRKVLAIVLILSLLLVVMFSLVSCNKKKHKDTTDYRQVYCDTLESSIITALDSTWEVNMIDNKIVLLDNAGEYVVTCGWANLIKDVVYSSSLQTAKIKSCADYLSTDDGKKLLLDFSENADLLIDLLDEVGFTSDDISSLIYGFAYSVVENSNTVLTDMVNRLSDLKANKFATAKALTSLNLYLGNINKSRESFVPTAVEKTNMLSALNDAKDGISDIVKFAYSISIDSLTDNIIDIIKSDDGALSDISNDEIKTVVNAVARNISQLKESLTATEIEKLNAALDLIIKKFDVTINSSLVFSQIVTYSKYAYMIVDAIPDLCDLIEAVATCIDDSMIARFKDYIVFVEKYDSSKDSDAKIITSNTAIMISSLLSKLAVELGNDKMNSMIDDLYAISNVGDYKKAFPMLLADIVVNTTGVLNAILDDETSITLNHPEIISEDDLIAIINVALTLNIGLDDFKKAYYEDLISGDEQFAKAVKIANDYDFSTIVSNAYSINYQPDKWYQTYVDGCLDYLNKNASKVLPKANADLKKYVEEYFENESPIKANTEKLATYTFTNYGEVVKAQECLDVANDAGLYYLALAVLIISSL